MVHRAQKHLCIVNAKEDDEYEDLGEIETGTHLQRMTFGDKLMDLVLFKVVGGREVTLSWKMAQFHTTEAHMKFGKWSNPSNLANDFGNDFLIFDLSLDCDYRQSFRLDFFLISFSSPCSAPNHRL